MEVQRTLGDVDLEEVSNGDGIDEVPEGAEEAFLSVEGMHCSACEVFIESRAEDHDGIETVEASYASELVKMVYDPDTVERGGLVDAVDGFGYKAHDPERGDERDDEIAELLTIGRLTIGAWLGMMVTVWYFVFL